MSNSVSQLRIETLLEALKEWNRTAARTDFVIESIEPNEEMAVEYFVSELERVENEIRTNKEIQKFMPPNTSVQLYDIIKKVKKAGNLGAIGHWIPETSKVGTDAKELWDTAREEIYNLMDAIREYSAIEHGKEFV